MDGADLGIGPEPRVVLVVDNLLHTLVEKSGELFFRYFRSRIAPFLKGLISIEDMSGIPEEYILHQLSGSLVSTIEWWLSEKPEESPEKIAYYYLKSNSQFIPER